MYNTRLEINLLCDLGYKEIEFCLNIQRKKNGFIILEWIVKAVY